MSKKTYEFDNRKPSVASKIGSTVIAVGSVATALTIAMPGAGAFFVPQSSAANSASAQTEAANTAALASGQGVSNAVGSNPTATGAEASNQGGSNLPTAMASTNADINLLATSDPTAAAGTTPLPSATASGVQAPTSNPTPTTAAPPLTALLPGPSVYWSLHGSSGRSLLAGDRSRAADRASRASRSPRRRPGWCGRARSWGSAWCWASTTTTGCRWPRRRAFARRCPRARWISSRSRSATRRRKPTSRSAPSPTYPSLSARSLRPSGSSCRSSNATSTNTTASTCATSAA